MSLSLKTEAKSIWWATLILALSAVTASCGGESPWEANSFQNSHQMALQNAHNQEVFISSYNDMWEGLDRQDDCDWASTQAEFYFNSLFSVTADIEGGKTTDSLGSLAWSLLEAQDKFYGQAFASSEWMEQHYCDTTDLFGSG